MIEFGLALDDPGTVVSAARAAEDAGFDLVAVGEHLFHPRSAPNPFIQLAAAAGATSRIRLASTVCLLPLYPAALAAKLAASLDQASGGRFALGVGGGGEYPDEFAAAGVDPRTRFRRLDEGLEVLRLLFTGRPVSFTGEFTRLTDARLDPPPVREGGPPIWIGGRRAGAIRRAGRFADVWLPYMVTPEMLADGLDAVRAAAGDHGRPANDVSGALFGFACVDADAGWARETAVAEVGATYGQDFSALADRYLLLGDPDRVTNRLLEYHRAGARTIVLHIAAPESQRHHVLATLTRDVLPAVRADVAATRTTAGRTLPAHSRRS